MMFDLFKIVIFHSYVKLPEGACVHVYVYIYVCVWIMYNVMYLHWYTIYIVDL